jgi:hypothetical protein
LNRPKEEAHVENPMAGEGCYVSATVQNRRYYGVLIDQAALQQASMLYFQEEASGLDLNRRMKALMRRQQHHGGSLDQNGSSSDTNGARKRPRTDATPLEVPNRPPSNSNGAVPSRQVQKFRYEGLEKEKSQGYRVLLATFADLNASAEDDLDRRKKIEAACEAGGDFLGDYYYQYEVRVKQGVDLMRLAWRISDKRI